MEENMKSKSKKKLWIAIVCIVLVVAIVSGVLIYFATKPKDDKEKEKSGLPAKKPVGAHAYLIEEGKKCGYKNAFSELSEAWVTKSGDLTYSRYQQNYKGIPVYGQTVVGVTDKDGEVISVTGNVEDVNEEISLTPTVKKDDVNKKIKAYLSEEYDITASEITFDLSDENLCIYGLYDYADTLCYDLDVEITLSEGITNIQLIVNATNGNIIYSDSGVRYETVTGKVTGDGGRKYENVTYTDDNGTYKLIDPKRRITAYYSNYQILYGRNSGNIFSPSYYVVDELHAFTGGELVVTWNSMTNVDQASLDAYVNVQRAYEFFDEVLEVRSFDGNGNTSIEVYTDIECTYLNGEYKNHENNAFFNFGNVIGVGKFDEDENNKGKYLDTMAHEFMHGVENYHSGMNYSGESGAIMEALSDIFGELVESWYKEKCGHQNIAPDWIHNTTRCIKAPEDKSNPSKYYGINWKDIYSKEDNGEVHNNSTVISHTAYLMHQNGFTTEELAKLWYNAMLMMPTDCNFYECRELVELAARNLKFSEDKQAIIDDVFDEVNIKTDDTVEEIEIKSNCEISVLDFVGDEYDDYTMSIWHVDINGKYPKTSNPLRNFVVNKKIIKNTTPYKANLEEGVYVLELIDNKIDINGEQKKVYKYLIVTDNGENKISIDADFGLIHIEGTVTDSEDKPLEGATVKLCVGDKYGRTYYKATTDSNGKYELDRIPYSDDFVYEEIYAEIGGMKQTISKPTLTRNNKIDFELASELTYEIYLPYLKMYESCFCKQFGMQTGAIEYYAFAKTREDALNKKFYKFVKAEDADINPVDPTYAELRKVVNFETEDECIENLKLFFTGDAYDEIIANNSASGTYMYDGKLYHVRSSALGTGGAYYFDYDNTTATKINDTKYKVILPATYRSYSMDFEFTFEFIDGAWIITEC